MEVDIIVESIFNRLVNSNVASLEKAYDSRNALISICKLAHFLQWTSLQEIAESLHAIVHAYTEKEGEIYRNELLMREMCANEEWGMLDAFVKTLDYTDKGNNEKKYLKFGAKSGVEQQKLGKQHERCKRLALLAATFAPEQLQCVVRADNEMICCVGDWSVAMFQEMCNGIQTEIEGIDQERTFLIGNESILMQCDTGEEYTKNVAISRKIYKNAWQVLLEIGVDCHAIVYGSFGTLVHPRAKMARQYNENSFSPLVDMIEQAKLLQKCSRMGFAFHIPKCICHFNLWWIDLSILDRSTPRIPVVRAARRDLIGPVNDHNEEGDSDEIENASDTEMYEELGLPSGLGLHLVSAGVFSRELLDNPLHSMLAGM
eukprot:561851-Rhodomonas_salina.1